MLTRWVHPQRPVACVSLAQASGSALLPLRPYLRPAAAIAAQGCERDDVPVFPPITCAICFTDITRGDGGGAAAAAAAGTEYYLLREGSSVPLNYLALLKRNRHVSFAADEALKAAKAQPQQYTQVPIHYCCECVRGRAAHGAAIPPAAVLEKMQLEEGRDDTETLPFVQCDECGSWWHHCCVLLNHRELERRTAESRADGVRKPCRARQKVVPASLFESASCSFWIRRH